MKAQIFNLYTIETLFLNRKEYKFEVILCAAQQSEDKYENENNIKNKLIAANK